MPPPETAKLLWDMLDAAKSIEAFTAGKTFDDYVHDKMLRSAVERQFEVIGEAMTRLVKRDAPVAQQITDYRKISGFRNALIHGYDTIDHVISWDIVQTKLPLLRHELNALLPPGAPRP
jgi:uncharacterized protein with HEPN domain